ncbi:MAG: UDP-glucose 4-epimerase GalE [Actinomycetota bacterium]|jgi:UDP-glucose 4-epimerase
MTWLVTGGAGYIGAHVVQKLVDAGHDVVVLDEATTGTHRLPPQVTLVQANLTQNQTLHRLFNDYDFEGVVHVAARKQVRESVEKPLFYWRENIGGLTNLLTAMQVHSVKNLVFSSSAAVYGQPQLSSNAMIAEDAHCNPINPYGATKLAGEWMTEALTISDDFKVVALRYFNVGGAGNAILGDEYSYNLIPIVFDALEKNESPIVFGKDFDTTDGTCIRDYVHVEDLADAHVSAVEYVSKAEPKFTAINIGTGKGSSVLEVMNMVAKVSGIEFEPKIVQARQGDPAALVADVSRAKELLNWVSKRSLEDIVRSAWLAKNP